MAWTNLDHLDYLGNGVLHTPEIATVAGHLHTLTPDLKPKTPP